MFERNYCVINKSKNKDFIQFMRSSTKDNDYWKVIKDHTELKTNKEDLDKLFIDSKKKGK